MTGLTLSPWMLPGLVGAALATLAALLGWRRRPAAGARELAVLGAGVAWWCLLQALVVATPTLEGKLLASKVQYLGICTVPLAWLWFAVGYTSRALRPAHWALLAIPEVASLLLAWTNEWHGLVWRAAALGPADGFETLRIDYGPWFRLHVYYAYALVMAGTALLAHSLSQSPHHRRRLVAVVVAVHCPAVANLVYLVGFSSPRLVDLTPTGFAVGGLVMAWSLLRDRLLDLPPVQRGKILEAIRDGIVVADSRGRVVDLNAAGALLLGCRPGDRLGEALLPAHPGAAPERVERGGRTLELTRSATDDVPGGGTVLIVRDVTEQERLEREVRRVGEELLRSNEELTRLANTDSLTGLASRRHLLELLEMEMRRSTRYGHPLSLLLLDVDHFKEINDALGHAAGDAVLRGVSDAIRESVRDVDIVGRIGGDEIAIVLPETGAEGAMVIARRLLARVRASPYAPSGSLPLPVTVSIGLVAAAPGADAEQLMHSADLALYRAKETGRDRVATPGSEQGEIFG